MKIVFFTCSTGPEDGFVPNIKQELPERLDAYYLHDGNIELPTDRGWKYLNITEQTDCPNTTYPMRQRFGRLLSHRWFPDADWTIYLDQKWYLHKDFFTTMVRYIEENPTHHFVVPKHSETRSLWEELAFPFMSGYFTFDYAAKVLKKLKELRCHPEDFTSTLTCLLIRKNTPIVNAANERWYSLLNLTYDFSVRDQLLLPYSGAPLTLFPDFDNFINSVGIMYYPETSRTPGQKEMDRLGELKKVYEDTFST
jgi:hypothetical protein